MGLGGYTLVTLTSLLSKEFRILNYVRGSNILVHHLLGTGNVESIRSIVGTSHYPIAELHWAMAFASENPKGDARATLEKRK
jgi:hypothetical protein